MTTMTLTASRESRMLSDIHSRVITGKPFNFDRYTTGHEYFDAFLEEHVLGMLGGKVIDITDGDRGLLWIFGSFYVSGSGDRTYVPLRDHHLRLRKCHTGLHSVVLGDDKLIHFEKAGKYVWCADDRYFVKREGKWCADWSRLVADITPIYELNPIQSRSAAWSKCNGSKQLSEAVRFHMEAR